MAVEKGRVNSDSEEPKDVDRVRDIIFGPQMRDYDQRFVMIQRDLERLRQELELLNEQVGENDREQSKRVQNLRREARQSDDDLRNELRQTAQRLMIEKVDRLALGDLLIEMGNHLKTGGLLSDTLGLIHRPKGIQRVRWQPTRQRCRLSSRRSARWRPAVSQPPILQSRICARSC